MDWPETELGAFAVRVQTPLGMSSNVSSTSHFIIAAGTTIGAIREAEEEMYYKKSHLLFVQLNAQLEFFSRKLYKLH